MSEIYEITDIAIRAAREAGAIALGGFRSNDLSVDTKRDKHDLVTCYDRACEAHIRRVVLEAFPDSSIVGEEQAAHTGVGPLTFYVDPIDGTSNFARGTPLWAVSIGVAREGELIVGVILDPVNDQLFWADTRGAFVRSGEFGGEDRPLRSEGTANPEQAMVALNFPLARDLVHYPDLALEQFAQVTHSFAQVRGLGSTCIALCWIAAGWLDVTISFETNPWDVAAGAFIIRQAGGVFHGYCEGKIVPESESHLAPHYYAAVSAASAGPSEFGGSSGEFELLHDIMRTQSVRPASLPDTAE